MADVFLVRLRLRLVMAALHLADGLLVVVVVAKVGWWLDKQRNVDSGRDEAGHVLVWLGLGRQDRTTTGLLLLMFEKGFLDVLQPGRRQCGGRLGQTSVKVRLQWDTK